jgi:hypothetical protein
MDQNGDTTTKQTFTPVWAIIEKIHELRWTLHLAVVVLFADLVLVWRSGRGIIHWSASADQLMANAGLLITGVLAFGVLMSFVMPMFGWIVRCLLSELIWRLKENDIDNPHDRGQVRPYELRDHALKKGDKLLLDIYEAHEQKKRAVSLEKLAYGQMLFAVLVLAFLDFYLADWFGIQGTTVLQALAALLGISAPLVLFSGVLLAGSGLWWAWFPEDGPDGIYYPPLCEEIKEQREKQRKLYEEIEEQQKKIDSIIGDDEREIKNVRLKNTLKCHLLPYLFRLGRRSIPSFP